MWDLETELEVIVSAHKMMTWEVAKSTMHVVGCWAMYPHHKTMSTYIYRRLKHLAGPGFAFKVLV